MSSADEGELSWDNTTICADQLIGAILQGWSGRIMWGILQLILMVLGNIGNVITLIVLNRRLMRKGGINNLLQGLAISDIVAPTIACIPPIIYYYGQKDSAKLVSFINSFIMPLATGATFCSNWIVVTITCFRLMIVVKPFYSQVYCSSQNERRALAIICVFSILSIVPYYYYYSQYEALNIVKLVSAVVSLLGPWIICVVLWILLIRVVNREIGLKKSKEFTLHSEVIAQRLKSKSKITRMVLIICFFNILCQLPVLILTIFGLVIGTPCGPVANLMFACLFFVSNLLLIVNHSINFFIYSLTNGKFRFTLKFMCRRCCYRCCCFCCGCENVASHPPATQQQTMNDDRSRAAHIERSRRSKLECQTCSNSKNHENQHLMIPMRVPHASKSQDDS